MTGRWTRRGLLAVGLTLSAVAPAAVAPAAWASDPAPNPVSDPASEAAAARAQVETLAHWADTVLSRDGLTPAAATDAFAGIVDEAFDLHRIARFVLGRHWPTASPDDRRRFQDLVRREIVMGFGRNLSQLRGRGLTVAESRWRGAGDVDVLTRVDGPGMPPLPVTFRLQRQDGAPFRIVDIQLLGFSLLTAQRQGVDARVQSYGGLSPMLDAMAR